MRSLILVWKNQFLLKNRTLWLSRSKMTKIYHFLKKSILINYKDSQKEIKTTYKSKTQKTIFKISYQNHQISALVLKCRHQKFKMDIQMECFIIHLVSIIEMMSLWRSIVIPLLKKLRLVSKLILREETKEKKLGIRGIS